MKTTFTLGDLTIHRIIEKQEPFRPALSLFPDLTTEQLAESRSWICPTSLTSDDEVIMCFQSYVVRTPHHTILIDTGIGNDKEISRVPSMHKKTDDTYMQALAAHGLTVNDVDYVLFTHLHVDHVGWNTRLENGRWVPTFPKARYLFTKKEYDHCASASGERRAFFIESVLPVVEAGRVDFVSNTHEIGDYVRLLPTPGHSPDHVAICIGRGCDDAVFVGDVMHSPLQTRHPDQSAAFDEDKEQSRATRHNVLTRYCDTATLCCTTHFPSVGRIKRRGDTFTWEMVGD